MRRQQYTTADYARDNKPARITTLERQQAEVRGKLELLWPAVIFAKDKAAEIVARRHFDAAAAEFKRLDREIARLEGMS